MFVKPRTETVIFVQINNPELGEGVISKQQIMPRLYLPSSVVKVNEHSQAITTILNVTDKEFLIPCINIRLDPVPNLKETMTDDKGTGHSFVALTRVKLLNQNLRLDHLNPEEKESLQKIIEEFNDIFYLE